MSKKLLVFLALVGLVGSACGPGGGGEVAAGTDAPASADPAQGADEAAEPAEHQDIAGPAGGIEAEAPLSEEGTLGFLMPAEAVRATSGRFEGTIQLRAQPGSGEEDRSFVMSGSFDAADRTMELTADLGALAGVEGLGVDVPAELSAAFEEPAVVRLVGDVVYVKWGLLAMFTGAADGWVAVPADELAASGSGYGLSAVPANPSDLLEELRSLATTSVEDLGTETVRDVETRHWRVVLDVAQLAALADPAGGEALTQQLASAGISQIPVDLWLGVDDDQVRRFQTELTVSGGSDEGTAGLAVSFELYDLGAEIDIAPPPAAEVVEAPSLDSF